MGIASITDGKYNTQSLGGRGTIGGSHIVEIERFSGVANDDVELTEDLSRRNRTPNIHREEFDIPQQSVTTKDFAISTN